MKEIEKAIVAAMKTIEHQHNEKRLSSRDVVRYKSNGDIVYYLYGSEVARVNYGTRLCVLGVKDGRWQTVTTKARINAIAAWLGLPSVSQKDYVWTWGDGVEYSGTRTFTLEEKK